jgi:hypothetical protein
MLTLTTVVLKNLAGGSNLLKKGLAGYQPAFKQLR